MHAHIAYNVCMTSIQYTIRNIPKPVDQVLRDMAAHKRQSFNQTVVDALEKATGASEQQPVYDDLDWFIGTSTTCDPEFDEAMDWLDSLPKDLAV